MTLEKRNALENSVIIKYLQKLEDLMNVLKSNTLSLNEMLLTVANSLRYQYLPADNAIFFYGEKGDKFYIILKGQVEVLISKPIIVDLSESEYTRYLMKIKQLGEHDILTMLFKTNKNVFPSLFEELYSQIIETSAKKARSFIKRPAARQTSNIEILKEEITKVVTRTRTISAKDYMNIYEPEVYSHSFQETKKSITIYKFFSVMKMKAGETFGEIALISENQKR